MVPGAIGIENAIMMSVVNSVKFGWVKLECIFHLLYFLFSYRTFAKVGPGWENWIKPSFVDGFSIIYNHI